MKKVGICTLHDAAPNFGATLQAFAMQEVLKSLGYEPEFLKFKLEDKSEKIKIEKLINREDIYFKKEGKVYKGIDTTNIAINTRLKKSNAFLRISNNIYDKENDAYDSIVIGSDELWNINNPSFEHRKEYYGYNLNSNNIFAYAPSCNTTTVDEFKEFHNNDIDFKNLEELSARDLNTMELLEEVAGRKANLVLDPTMLMDGIVKYAKIPKEKDYILVYDYRVTGERKKLIQKLAKEKNLPIYAVGFYCSFADKNIDADIFEFIGYVKNATYVITATFHGTIFSILNEKQFASYACLGYKIEDLLRRFNLEDRDASNADDLAEIVDKKIDYSKVNDMIDVERKKSLKYLKEALEAKKI